MSTLETQYRNYLRENPSSPVDFNLWKVWHGNQIKQALINMMEKDEELGLYDYGWCKGKVVLPREEIKLEDIFNDDKKENIKKFIHEVKSIPTEEILANRCNAYEFIDFDKKETLEEAAERNYNEQKLNTYTPYNFKDAFIEGAKWQQERSYIKEEVLDTSIQIVGSNNVTTIREFLAEHKWQQEQERSYSEEEVIDIAKQAFVLGKDFGLIGTFNEWFEQFKKK